MDGESILKSVARGALRLVAPAVVECHENAEEIFECSEVLGETLVLENTWDEIEKNGEAVDRVMTPIRQAKSVLRALRSHRLGR